ncbi:Hsp20/alpha crystallin family protein [Pectinatus brassicae]|uniref:HSP20 family protein n=1 Tax=Pectinatus brassicae TaxID=862415 RepID=A0A840UNN9_9FIRM|nr:Hsp20/alpha crystallin family protein [Pectinatus brassicae]MBB5336318.1 HSP20 family protein [Pectinatus brassicae]
MFGLVPFSKNNITKKGEGFDRLFDIFNEPFFSSALAPMHSAISGFASFKVDVKDLGTAYELAAELPGMKKEDISLSYDNGYLTIQTSATSSNEEENDDGKYLRRERRYGSMSRSFYIDNIDESKVTAQFENGILIINLPKTEPQSTAKQIDID